MTSRDPLSTRYDGVVDDLMRRAARASRQGKGIRTWVASPRSEFHRLDGGGRTRHERAFVRSCYFQVRGRTMNPDGPVWSLKISWGDDGEVRPSDRGRLARPVVLRLFPREDAEIPARSYLGHAPDPY